MVNYRFSVSINAQYLEDQSAPEQSHYVFAYSITVRNSGHVAAQLVARHWIITDANNNVDEVKGLGVVGQQPFLQPGEEFHYTSGASLTTPQGVMKGEFFCVAEDGQRFKAAVPECVLSFPRTLH